MLGKYTFLTFDICFSIIPILFAVFRHRKAVVKYRKLFYRSLLTAPFYAILTDVGTYFHAWRYSYNETLGITIFGSVLETDIWAVILVFSLCLIVAVFAEKEEKKKSFKPYF